jgi:O-antigen/teichoic acid export membrane protein
VSDPVPSPRQEAPQSASGGQRGLLKLLSRASWNLIDQVLSALTNVVLAILVVHAAGAKAFDAFAVAFLLFSMVIGVERALVAQPLSIRHSKEAEEQRRVTVSRATGLVVGITFPAAVLMVTAGTAIHGRIGSTLIATAVVLPFLIMQDACRYAFFTFGKAQLAALNDALWAAVQFSAMGLLMIFGAASAVTLVFAWGGAATFCVLVALVQLRSIPNPLATVSWLREHRDLVGYLLGEYMLSTGAFTGGYLVVGLIVGDQAVGSIRAGQVLVGPLQIVSGAIMSFGLPELSRRTDLPNMTRRKIAIMITSGMASMSLVYAGLLFLVPDSWGVILFQGKWGESQGVLLPLALAMACSTSALGPAMVAYALGQARKVFRIMTVEAPFVFCLMIGGSVLFGVEGAAWGQFIDQFLMIGLFYIALRRVLRENEEERLRATLRVEKEEKSLFATS